MNNDQVSQVSGSVFDACSLTPKNSVGAVCRFADGRAFRYCSTATVFAAGEGLSSEAATAVTANACAAAAIGDKTVTITIASVTLNQYANGYLFITDDAGQGYTYKIKSNTATTAGVVVVTLCEGLKVALTTASDIVLQANRCSLVIQWTATSDPVGVAVVPTTGAAAATPMYFWAQYQGPGLVIVGSATSLALGYSLAATAAGKVVAATAGASYIGRCLSAAEDADGYQPCLLEIT